MINKETINTWYEEGQKSKSRFSFRFPLFSTKRHSTFNEEALEDEQRTLLANMALANKLKEQELILEANRLTSERD